MGTIASLCLGELEVAWSKNEFLLSHNDLFQADCLKSKLVDGDEGGRPEEWYELSLGLIKDRLELMGYTLELAENEHSNPSPFSDDDPLPLSFHEVLNILRNADVSKVSNEYRENPRPGVFAPEHIQEIVRSTRDLRFSINHWDLSALLENFSPYSQLRVLAENPANIELPVIWDFDGVVRNGWIERDHITHGTSRRFLIVTEGSSDSKILRKAIDLLKPHIKDFFYFVDMEDGYPFTGTGNLFNFVKGLSSIGIENDILVIFDNDVEGVQAMSRCLTLNLPKNMQIMKLPDLAQFQEFPTIGPHGEALANINGSAASIECYLDLGEAAKVRWTNYREDTSKYQGSLVAKDRYKKQFLKQSEKKADYDYRKLLEILDQIVLECTQISANKALHRTSR
ncbi:HEPN/Toprim-associated domain-containing protein [Saccharospirillum impatiens]|uniref:HEPN/Toprim-associated domain-containing protein n=1 Tax=Saccharospirillum impatiens TaxID=169438 RepID=UPI0003FC0B3E|nr:HEPN/Toprim-associated domain-containing protein [Saccharospirillum impatiens]